MSETEKKKKVIKKVKIKKPSNATSPTKVEAAKPEKEAPKAPASEFSFIEEELANINLDEHIKPSKSDDDEFETLLNNFIRTEINGDIDAQIAEAEELVRITGPKEVTKEEIKAKKDTNKENSDEDVYLKADEAALYRAYTGFIKAVNKLAETNGLPNLEASVQEKALSPNYKPSVGRKIASDTVKGWDIIINVKGSELSGLDITSSDDELLDFAEDCTDDDLTLCIISYVETIIEIESCELVYLEKSQVSKRKRIERQIYEEHQRRIERNKRYIAAIQKKRFPINAERLINNYFKTALKDPDGAYKVLTTNPAVFAPIEVDKIKPRMFGLIKPTPKEGIRINQRIASFLKKLKA